jgi:hypothetical protein
LVEPFEQLDFVYTPSADVAADMERFVSQLGASAGSDRCWSTAWPTSPQLSPNCAGTTSS